ncbi:germinal center-associated signaling and motility-like protein isoform X1 [Fukomys damarensis]|uniref:germinal center-associated signaling and motility-like protein isoform X1 n=1 Tax=Fukomys damarensis TaxID=885580 RepID=UPI00053FE7C8|nr:germinal center-associated signaling and motility-like protein isoform X1 [Fukomys damarensis]
MPEPARCPSFLTPGSVRQGSSSPWFCRSLSPMPYPTHSRKVSRSLPFIFYPPGKEFPSSSYQEETSSGLEEVCYTVIDHTAHWRPSLNSNDHSYENLDATRNGDRFLREGSETEYALLRTSVEVSSSCSPEQDYELVLPH